MIKLLRINISTVFATKIFAVALILFFILAVTNFGELILSRKANNIAVIDMCRGTVFFLPKKWLTA